MFEKSLCLTLYFSAHETNAIGTFRSYIKNESDFLPQIIRAHELETDMEIDPGVTNTPNPTALPMLSNP